MSSPQLEMSRSSASADAIDVSEAKLSVVGSLSLEANAAQNYGFDRPSKVKSSFESKEYSSLDASVQKFLPELGTIEKGKTTKEVVKINGESCEYYLRVPQSYDAAKPMPLILAFHGYGDKPGQGGAAPGALGMETTSGLSERAEKDGFVIAYLNGNPKEKNAWNNKQWFFSDRNDIEFTKTVMDELSKDLNIDQSKIYLVGFSNGGSFVHSAAAQLSDRVAAIADVSGWMTGKEKAQAKGVSVLSIHSEDDPSVLFKGRPLWQGVVMKPSEYTPNHYRQINNLPVAPAITVEKAGNDTEIQTSAWKDESGIEVKSIFIEKEGHLWFGGKADEAAPINATDEVLEFFNHHQKVTKP